MDERIHLGKWTEEELTSLMEDASALASPGERIAFLSGFFLNTKYREATLEGDMTEEVCVIHLEEVDCVTFIEYVEAMRRAKSFKEFRQRLKEVRYRSGNVSYAERNHFFTDWKAHNADYIVDVTPYIHPGRSKEVSKRLNDKGDGTFFVPGVVSTLREVTYLPSVYVDDEAVDKLETGDYIGIYSKIEGLDVSHTGIFIREEGRALLRHASSQKKYRKVIDEDFLEYLRAKAGIVVLRPRD